MASRPVLATGTDLPTMSQPALAIQLGPGPVRLVEDSAGGSPLWAVSGQACGFALRTSAKDTLGHTCVPTWLGSGPSQAGMHTSLPGSGVGSVRGPWAPRDQAFCLYRKVDVLCRESDTTVVFFIKIYFRISGVICFPNLFPAFVLIRCGLL